MPFDASRFAAKPKAKRYPVQLKRVRAENGSSKEIEDTVTGVLKELNTNSASALVIYGDPQSGKTEMMICLTAALLDAGHKVVIHLLNDSVDLLGQNRGRFVTSGVATLPTSRSIQVPAVLFCKKNGRDLQSLRQQLTAGGLSDVIVIDDEADFATPNSKINSGGVTPINAHIASLIGQTGRYIGVTATPARLDLNNTFGNQTQHWVHFRPHAKYNGPDDFFPLDANNIKYTRTFLQGSPNPTDARDALLRFLLKSAYLNTSGSRPDNYTMLVHTSGTRTEHDVDYQRIAKTIEALSDTTHSEFMTTANALYALAEKQYGKSAAQDITEWVVDNMHRAMPIVLNSTRDRQALGSEATIPKSPFTIIIGGNIVSRGVTFPNLLSMYFTRNVKGKLQQDTYIQRARMFGARGDLLQHFELTIPIALYQDWYKCFVFHRLAVGMLSKKVGPPVWISDSRTKTTASSSIDGSTVRVDSGEMGFAKFKWDPSIAQLISSGPTSVVTLEKLRNVVGDDALPKFLLDFIATSVKGKQSPTLQIHKPSLIGAKAATYTPQEIDNLERTKGFISTTQLKAYPNAEHHIFVLHNPQGGARIIYRYESRLLFLKNP